MPWSEWIKEPVCWLVCYLIIANLAGFAMMGIDKYKAKHERWRTRERTLMLTAALGGSVGVFCGMRVFHHKTLHKLFRWGVPAIMAVQAALATEPNLQNIPVRTELGRELRRFFCACDNCVIEVRERLMC